MGFCQPSLASIHLIKYLSDQLANYFLLLPKILLSSKTFFSVTDKTHLAYAQAPIHVHFFLVSVLKQVSIIFQNYPKFPELRTPKATKFRPQSPLFT